MIAPRFSMPTRRLAPFVLTGTGLDPAISPVRKKRAAPPVAGVLFLSDRTITHATACDFNLGDGLFTGNDGRAYDNYSPVAGQYYTLSPDVGVGDFVEFKWSLLSGALDFTPGNGLVPDGSWSDTDAGLGGINAFNNNWPLPGVDWQKTSNGTASFRVYVRFTPSTLPNPYSAVAEEKSAVITMVNT